MWLRDAELTADASGLGHARFSPADISIDPERESVLRPDLFVAPPRGVRPPPDPALPALEIDLPALSRVVLGSR